MSAIYGKAWKINVVVKGTPDIYYPIGGTVLNAKIDARPTIHSEVGSGEGRQISAQKIVAAKPLIEWTMNIRDLEDYILESAMITDEGVVPAHVLYVTDGSEHHDFGLCKVNSCRITIRQLESIKAALSVFIKTHAPLTPETFNFRTFPAMYKNAVTTLTLNTVDVVKWSEIEFGVGNNVLQEILGVDILPSEVEEQEARYSMRITRARVGATSKFGNALDGTTQDFVIALTDNEETPVTKTFTFADMYLSTTSKEDRGLGIVYERIEGKGKSMVIS